MVLIVSMICFGASERSLEVVFGDVLKKTQSNFPAGKTVCFYNLGMDRSGDLQTYVIHTTLTVAYVHVDLEQWSKLKKCDVSTCDLNVLFLSKRFTLDELFKLFSFDKYAKFIVVYTEQLESLTIATFLHRWGITNVLFLEQGSSSIYMFAYNLLLTEKIFRTTLDADLFPNKVTNLTGYPYSIIALYTKATDVEYEHGQYLRLNLLEFIISRQNATGNYRIMYEKSPKIFSSNFDVIIPYLRGFEFKNDASIEQASIPMTTRFCLVVPKVRDPDGILILFRPFRFQLWALIIVCYSLLNWIKHHFADYLATKLPLKRTNALAESFCLFILCESYSAKLTAFLNSPIDTIYPQTFTEFRSSTIQLLVPHPEFMAYAATMPVLHGKHVLYDPVVEPDWDQVALIDNCNCLKNKLIPEPQSDMGAVLSSSRYHVIDQPLFAVQYSLLFNKRSFLVKNTEEIIKRMFEVGVLSRIIKERKREAGKSINENVIQHQDAFYGFMPVFRSLGRMFLLSSGLFVLEWMHVLVFRQIYYNIVFLIALRVLLCN